MDPGTLGEMAGGLAFYAMLALLALLLVGGAIAALVTVVVLLHPRRHQ